ncbi:hypothetical protein Q4601_17715 [Shewanella sp. 1_MG-2023]|uniref:hypothetical protein n=1 Tax=unclassified Shewanella TaxID=196818 RepID=UPI00105456B1|nr:MULTISPECIES: hypothetical protein [unclassified Shewanella]MDO6613588.1 hypothetical protein [Shewanella sp. 7_MG-2023]MDO6773603.1 hypothetical protein [Shewanella sp. 2_MG-2023]MDO6796138.1 hypothetical protein [Shewanella sp. 1_MG-2023]
MKTEIADYESSVAMSSKWTMWSKFNRQLKCTIINIVLKTGNKLNNAKKVSLKNPPTKVNCCSLNTKNRANKPVDDKSLENSSKSGTFFNHLTDLSIP